MIRSSRSWASGVRRPARVSRGAAARRAPRRPRDPLLRRRRRGAPRRDAVRAGAPHPEHGEQDAGGESAESPPDAGERGRLRRPPGRRAGAGSAGAGSGAPATPLKSPASRAASPTPSLSSSATSSAADAGWCQTTGLSQIVPSRRDLRRDPGCALALQVDVVDPPRHDVVDQPGDRHAGAVGMARRRTGPPRRSRSRS